MAFIGYMRNAVAIAGVLVCLNTSAQPSASDSSSPWKWQAYLETYIQWSRSSEGSGRMPAYIFSHNRLQVPSVNLAMGAVQYQSHRMRSRLALAAGTYMQSNLAGEPAVLKQVMEASIGIRLATGKGLWLEGGIMPSHIGFESAVGAECATLTRSMMADNSPYYETGFKLTWQAAGGKWSAAALLINGWQRIRRLEGNRSMAVGHQIQWKPNSKWLLNSSSFAGNVGENGSRQMRYFHNFYCRWQPDDRWEVLGAADFGAEKQPQAGGRYHTWLTPVLVVRRQTGKRTWLAARAEYFQDREGVIIPLPDNNPFEMWGASVNADLRLSPNWLLRMESKLLHSRLATFYHRGNRVNGNPSLCLVICASW